MVKNKKGRGGRAGQGGDADRIEYLSSVPTVEVGEVRCARGSSFSVRPRPLIDVWLVHRRPQLAAEKAETEGRCGSGTVRREGPIGLGQVAVQRGSKQRQRRPKQPPLSRPEST